ncbi:MAG TPA: MBL fold metallo-hydrolase [Fibrobacteria bacterium]|nr:MBL fold metallo-hydrolase [Fibrobacteria bacterium]
MALEHLIFPSGPLGTNSALIWCDRTNEGILVDPGGEPEEILDLALARRVCIRNIVVTHAHPDNIGALPLVRDETSSGVSLHREDIPLWEAMAELCGELGMPAPDLPEVDEYLSEGHRVTFGKEDVEIIHLPGHSPGHCGILVRQAGLCLIGDCCFSTATGRTDLWGGDEPSQQRTLERLSRMDPAWTLVPGHGQAFSASDLPRAKRMKSTNI